MNKLYDENLYFLSLITWCLNPLDFNYTKDGIEINYDDYKIVINGKIDSSSNFTYVLPKKKQDFIKNNFNNKLVVVTTVYDKYGYSGKTYYDKYIPIDKTNLFEDNDNSKILNFILDSKNKIKNFTNYNIQYESSQLRCTEKLDTIISELLCESLKKLKIENKKYCKINVK